MNIKSQFKFGSIINKQSSTGVNYFLNFN